MLELAHRGRHASHELPDNSVDAIEAALRAGRDGVEIDVRRTYCGTPVLWHDRTAPDGRLVADIMRTELSRLAGYEVPELSAVLTRFAGAYFDIEVKTDAAALASRDALRSADPRRTLVTSFRHDVAAMLARSGPLECGLIVAHRPPSGVGFPWAIAPRLSTIVWEFEMLDPALATASRSAGFRNFAWNVATEADRTAAAAMSLDGIIVDR